MPEWRYLLSEATLESAQDGDGGLVRVPVGGPVSLAEYVRPNGEWAPDDSLWKAKYEGADLRAIELESAQAHQLIRRWVEIGRLTAQPSEESAIPPETAARLVEADRQAAEAWSQVEMPPGADSITF